MATDDELPRAIIERVLSGPPETCIDVSIDLLQMLANALSNVIGEDGFESLLFRAARRVGNEHIHGCSSIRARGRPIPNSNYCGCAS